MRSPAIIKKETTSTYVTQSIAIFKRQARQLRRQAQDAPAADRRA